MEAPSDDKIRERFKQVEYSLLNLYKYSHYEHYHQEMQSVNVCKIDNVAFDWTFQATKNYILSGAKAIFTGLKGSIKEIIKLGIVLSQAKCMPTLAPMGNLFGRLVLDSLWESS